jgi:hypothetical protein
MRVFVLPEAQHCPPLLLEQGGMTAIPFDIPLNLWPPVVSVAHRPPLTVFGAPVPPAAVAKDDETPSSENQIRPYWTMALRSNREVDAKPEPARVQ